MQQSLQLRRTEIADIPGWLGMAAMGLGLVIGGALALIFAFTIVVLPYDEQFLGMSRDQLAAVNSQLLPYMAHNRVSLGGAMIALGLLYIQVAYHAMREGEVWGRQLLILSAGVGFASFLLCVFYGYIDPLHLLVTAILLVFFLIGISQQFIPQRPTINPVLSRQAQMARLLLLLVGIAVLGGGAAVSLVGSTVVFVPQDLHFMDTPSHHFHVYNENLVPLIAHDRAAFGGILVANGIGVILMAWWGFQPGQRWLWWTFALAGLPGFATAIGTHIPIGYLDVIHLAPAVMGAMLYGFALLVSYPILCAKHLPTD